MLFSGLYNLLFLMKSVLYIWTMLLDAIIKLIILLFAHINCLCTRKLFVSKHNTIVPQFVLLDCLEK